MTLKSSKSETRVSSVVLADMIGPQILIKTMIFTSTDLISWHLPHSY